MPKTVNVDTAVVKIATPFLIGGVLGAVTKTREPDEEAPFKERFLFDLVVSTTVTVLSTLVTQAAVSWINKNRR